MDRHKCRHCDNVVGNVLKGGENASVATLLMWSVYLVNSVIMLIRWMREANRNS